MDLQGRLSNTGESSKSAGQQGFTVSISPGTRIPKDTKSGKKTTLSVWLDLKGQLSNPASKLNQAVDGILANLQAMGFVPGTAVDAHPAERRKVLRPLTKSQVDELVRLYREGSSAPVLARRFGIHRTTVLLHLQRRGVPRRVNSRKLNDEQVKEIKLLREMGLSYNELGQRYKVSADTIKRELDSKNA